MTTQISSKLAALAISLLMNCCIIGGVAYLFDIQSNAYSIVTAQDGAAAQPTSEAA